MTFHDSLTDIPMTYRWAARAEAVTRTSGEMGHRHRRPKTRSPLFWCGRKGRFGITLYGIRNWGRAQVGCFEHNLADSTISGKIVVAQIRV